MTMTGSLAFPRITPRAWPILRRHMLVWRKLALASVLGNIADPLIALLAFGYGMGRLLPEVQGVPYIVFLAAGSLAMSAMMTASFEAVYSAFSRMHVQKTWDALLNAPLELDDVLVAEWIWSALKSVISAIAICAVIFALGISRSPLLAWLPLVAFATGLAFGAMALCMNALARGYDFFTYWFTLVLTPMTFLSGVWFPRDQMPEWLAAFSQWLPLSATIDLARPLVLGRLPEAPLRSLAVLAVTAIVALWVAALLTRRRFAR